MGPHLLRPFPSLALLLSFAHLATKMAETKVRAGYPRVFLAHVLLRLCCTCVTISSILRVRQHKQATDPCGRS